MSKPEKLIHRQKNFFSLLSKLGFGKKTPPVKQQHKWNNYIDGVIGRPHYYLYSQALTALSSRSNKHTALELGPGAGDIVVDLVEKGWDVTGVDKAARSGEIIQERIKHLSGKFHFQEADFQDFQSDAEYDLVLSFFSLPFLPKENLNSLFNKLRHGMKSDAVLAANFFGAEHTWVKNGLAHPLTQDELMHLLDKNNFKLDFFLNRIYEQPGFDNNPVHWEVFDVIAVKS